MRVLLADDHSIVRRGLRGLLEAAGLTVVAEAADGPRRCGSATSIVLIR
jgi:DNA-binding NarL/FixJ family response regulator